MRPPLPQVILSQQSNKPLIPKVFIHYLSAPKLIVTESNENFTLNTEESKVPEDQQPVEIPDAPKENGSPIQSSLCDIVIDESSHPQTETNAPVAEVLNCKKNII